MQDSGHDQLGARVTSGLRWATLSRVLTQALTWGSTLLVVRLLAPVDYGLAAMAGVLAGYLTLWNELGLSVTLIQRRTTDDTTLRAVFGILLAIGVALCLLTGLASPLIAGVFGDPRITPLARLVSLNFLLMPFVIIPHALLSIDMNIRALSLVGLICALTGAAVTLGLAYLGFGAYALIWGPLATTFTRAIILNLRRPFAGKPTWRPAYLREYASFSMNVLLSRTVWYWYSESDNLIVGRLLGANLLGVYSLGRQLAQMPMERVTEITNMIALPAYASVGNDPARVRDAYIKTIRLVAVVAFPVFWGLALVADDLVPLVMGARWTGAVPVLQILCIVMPLRTIGTLATAPLLALGRADSALNFSILPALLIPLSLLIGIRWGLAGVAAAWAVAYPIAFVAATFRTRSVFNASMLQLCAPMAAPALSAALMVAAVAAILALTSWPSLVLLVSKTLLGMSIYAGLLLVVSRPHFDDALNFMRRLVVRKRLAP